MPSAGGTPKRETTASHTGNENRRASNTAESFRRLPVLNPRYVGFVISNQRKFKFHHRCFHRACGLLTFPGQERAAEGGKRGVGETRNAVWFHALPSTFPPPSPLSPRDLVRTPRPERSPSQPLLVRRSAPRSGYAPRYGFPGVGPSPRRGPSLPSLIIAPSVSLPFQPQFNLQFASSHWLRILSPGRALGHVFGPPIS